jgi:AmmeMemoRadiSam system protein A
MQLLPETCHALLDIACNVIARRLGGTGVVHLPDDPALSQPAGCFVSLHRTDTHALRGCIGAMPAGRPLVEVVAQAAGGVLEDPRFVKLPITLAELPQLDVEVTVLGPLQGVSSPLAFHPLDDGIFITIAGRSGCFLPQVARETGWTREQLLSRLCSEKLGLPANAWHHPTTRLEIFSTQIIGPIAISKVLAGKGSIAKDADLLAIVEEEDQFQRDAPADSNAGDLPAITREGIDPGGKIIAVLSSGYSDSKNRARTFPRNEMI